jgi:hypothetical protein
MPTKHLAEIKRIEEKLTGFNKAINEFQLSNTRLIQDLVLVIRKPGWTTIADIAFVNTHIDSMMGQLKNLNEQLNGFVQAAKLVETTKERIGMLN